MSETIVPDVMAVSALARTLATAADRGQVLDALCQGISSSLSAHAAYVALNRARADEAVVCSSIGVQTPPFRTLRLPHGAGLGGRVASDGMVRATEDYPADRDLVHVEALDRRVLDEGLRGIVAAPLRKGNAVVGAALAGVRDARRFGERESVVLQGLCDVAGAALERVSQLSAVESRARNAELLTSELTELNRRQRQMLAQRPDVMVRERSEMLADLLAERDDNYFFTRCRALGLDPEQDYYVLVAAPEQDSAESSELPVRVVREDGLTTAVALACGSAHVVLLPGQGFTAPAAWLRECLGPGAVATIGIAGPTAGVDSLRGATREATRTVRLLQALGRIGATGDAADLGPLAMLAAGAEPGEVADFVNRTLAPLLGVEPPTRDRLLTTLVAWFDHGGTVKRVARALDVHVNTVYGRLDKLDAILGPDWQDARRLELETAVRLQLLGTGVDSRGQGSIKARPTILPSRSIP